MKKTIVYFFTAAVLAAGCLCRAQDKAKPSVDSKQKTLVAFFSRAGENYKVGYVEKGNTQIVAEIISEQTGGKLFRIETETPYPNVYNECLEITKKEGNANARPAVKNDISVEDYNVVFIGFPIWWGDMPMAVYTFLEKHNWKGKTIIPFCTHEGSGFSGTEASLGRVCGGATLLKGVAIQGHTAQNSKNRVKNFIAGWLEKLKLQ